MEQPKLVLSAAGSHIEALTCRVIGERADFLIRRGYHAKKNYMSLITLKGVCVAADQPALFDSFCLQCFKKFTLDELGLRFCLQADHAHCPTGIARIVDAGDNLRNNRVGFGLVDRVLVLAGTISVLYVTEYERLERISRIRPQRIERRAVACITEVIRELDNFRHATKMLA